MCETLLRVRKLLCLYNITLTGRQAFSYFFVVANQILAPVPCTAASLELTWDQLPGSPHWWCFCGDKIRHVSYSQGGLRAEVTITVGHVRGVCPLLEPLMGNQRKGYFPSKTVFYRYVEGMGRIIGIGEGRWSGGRVLRVDRFFECGVKMRGYGQPRRPVCHSTSYSTSTNSQLCLT